MNNSEEITRQLTSISLQILRNARNELYLNMRFLDLALSSLEYRVTTDLTGIGTDGFALYVHPKVLADLYEQDRRLVNRVYLHTVYHCLFRHLLKTGKYPERLWHISCDMAVEMLIDSRNVRSVRMGGIRYRMDWQERISRAMERVRQPGGKGEIQASDPLGIRASSGCPMPGGRLERQAPAADGTPISFQSHQVLTAERICRFLMQASLPEYELRHLEREYCIDDHSLWPKPEPPGNPPPPQMQVLQNRWQDISEKTQTEMETFSKEASVGAGDLLEAMQVENRERYDYRSFLRKFAVMKEEMQVDPDTFDYVFYSYGLSLYGNMPLIEPQEYKEVHKIEEFVLVIDVSMSCSGELVKTFLEQTYAVLTESETYLRKVNIRILQCDEQVRADQKITSQKGLKEYMEHFQLKGNGGTDFRPAFAYVDQLIEEKEFLHLKGMLYFTDGYGTFPRRRPSYDTAFVFMEEDYTDASVPPWAIKLVIGKEDLEEEIKPRTDDQFIWEENQK